MRPADFARYVGETVKVRMAEPVAGRRKFQGRLLEAADDHIVMDSGGIEHRLAYADMERARLVPKF